MPSLSTMPKPSQRLNVVIAGGGVAAVELALALGDLAGRIDAGNSGLRYLSVHRRRGLLQIQGAAGAEQRRDALPTARSSI